MRRVAVLLLCAFVPLASAGVRIDLGPGVVVTVPRVPRGWRAPFRDLDADYGRLHVTAGVLPSSGGDLAKLATRLAGGLAEQHDSEIYWKSVQKTSKGRIEVWFESKQENRKCKGVVALLKGGAVTYAVTCFWPRTSRQAEIEAHRAVGSFRKTVSE